MQRPPPLYKNNEVPRTPHDWVGYYPWSAWSSFAYLAAAGVSAYKAQWALASACGLMSVASFFWWANQERGVQKLDHALILYLFMWPTLYALHAPQTFQLTLLALIITGGVMVGGRIMIGLHILQAIISAVALVLLAHFVPVAILGISVILKYTVPKFGTALFHIGSSAAIVTLVLRSYSFK